MKVTLLVAVLVACLGQPAALHAEQATTRYTNVELVSVDAQTRLVVVKNSEGRQETLLLDDTVAGLAGFHGGDRVILTVRAEPGMSRISAIVKSGASTTRVTEAPAAAIRAPVTETATMAPALRTFADQVAALARQAAHVDALWSDFITSCSATVQSSYSEGRDWFSLWDGAAQMDVTSGNCRDLFNQIVAHGESVKTGMVGAEEAARKAALAPGDLRDVRRQYAMEWGGWSLPAPNLLRQ